MTQLRPEKSTTVRLSETLARTSFRAESALAPRRAARRAADLWFTAPPTPAAPPLPAGGHRFVVTSLGAPVHGHYWGDGPVVYLVHGWGGRGAQLAAYLDPLVAAGHRVVMFDAPAHGDSPGGASGPGRTHAVEFARALDAVAARFGPAEAVIAHSMGAIATYLAIRYGWLGARRLVLVAPMVELGPALDAFHAALGLGTRARAAFAGLAEDLVGLPLADFDARVQAAGVDGVPTLVVHDLSDRQVPYAGAQRLVRGLPDARLLTTDALGHRRILADPKVVREVLGFLRVRPAAVEVA